jgi:lipid-A-disaccharide synthase
MKRFFMVAGELSGDTHGAGLMRALQEFHGPVEFLGLGGPQMRAVGREGIEDWVAKAGVVGLWEVLKIYGFFKRKFDETLSLLTSHIKPETVILVDYPGFNLRLAKALRKNGFKEPILFYISPQVWAWKKGRIKTMAKLLDLMICIFPFEKPLYEKSGLRTVFAGHPMVDRVKSLRKDIARESGLVGFFPGSRANEVTRLLPTMLQAVPLVRAKAPAAHFVISAANEGLKAKMLEIIGASSVPEAKDWIEVGTVYDLMQRVEVGAVASGTATLEAACFGLPYVLVYTVNPITYAVGKSVMRLKHLGIINILAGNEDVVTELVQGDFNPQRLATELTDLLTQPARRAALQESFARVVALLGEGGAYRRAADAVMDSLSTNRS